MTKYEPLVRTSGWLTNKEIGQCKKLMGRKKTYSHAAWGRPWTFDFPHIIALYFVIKEPNEYGYDLINNDTGEYMINAHIKGSKWVGGDNGGSKREATSNTASGD